MTEVYGGMEHKSRKDHFVTIPPDLIVVIRIEILKLLLAGKDKEIGI